MVKVSGDWWVSKREQTLNGVQADVGQLIQPGGGRNDVIVFGDNTRWAYQFHGSEAEVCGTDGCPLIFVSLGALDRHRVRRHAVEREYSVRRKVEEARYRHEREEAGETIGGHEVVKEKDGPRGKVPYIKMGR